MVVQPEEAADWLALTLTVRLRTTQRFFFFKTVRASESPPGWPTMCVYVCVCFSCAPLVSKHFTPLWSHELEAEKKATRRARNHLLSLPDSPDGGFFFCGTFMGANNLGVCVCANVCELPPPQLAASKAAAAAAAEAHTLNNPVWCQLLSRPAERHKKRKKKKSQPTRCAHRKQFQFKVMASVCVSVCVVVSVCVCARARDS